MDYERVAARFQQRLAETVARYEADIILMQERHQDELDALNKHIGDLNKDSNDDVVPETPTRAKSK